MIALRFDNVSKTYLLHKHNVSLGAMVGLSKRPAAEEHIFYALKNVSFEIGKGEAFGIVGRNGAGKSTILKIISGITRQSAGHVEVNGLVSSLIELGAGFHPDLTGRENIYMNGAIMGIPKKTIDKKLEEIVDFAELWEFIDVPVKKYSSGMYARLGFSVAVSVDPEILVVDEILSVGDIFFQQKCFKKMREIKLQGTTFIFVTHDAASMQNICDTAMLIDAGKVELVGPPPEVVSRYYAKVGKSAMVKGGVKPQPIPLPGNDQSINANRAEIIKRSILKDSKSRHGEGGIEMVAARVTDATGEDTLKVGVMETLRFTMLLKANQDITEPTCGIHLYNRMNTLVFAAGTRQLRHPLPPMKSGAELVVVFDLSFSVERGEYTFSLGASEPADEDSPNVGVVHDRHEMLGPIQVTADETKTFPFYGIAHLPLKVSHGKPE